MSNIYICRSGEFVLAGVEGWAVDLEEGKKQHSELIRREAAEFSPIFHSKNKHRAMTYNIYAPSPCVTLIGQKNIGAGRFYPTHAICTAMGGSYCGALADLIATFEFQTVEPTSHLKRALNERAAELARDWESLKVFCGGENGMTPEKLFAGAMRDITGCLYSGKAKYN